MDICENIHKEILEEIGHPSSGAHLYHQNITNPGGMCTPQ